MTATASKSRKRSTGPQARGTASRAARARRWFLYILRCNDGTLYTGIAVDVAARLLAHEQGKGARYTRGRGPLTLCASLRCHDRSDALRLELAIKGLSRAEKERVLSARKLAAFARKHRAAASHRAASPARKKLTAAE